MRHVAVTMSSGFDKTTPSPSMALLNEPIPSKVLLPFLDYRSILVADAKLAGEVTLYA
jgi:hypothetical protein